MKMKKFLKKNSTPLLLFLLLLILVVIGVLVVAVFVPSNNNTTYGDRLNEIEQYPISEETITNVKEKMIGSKKFDTSNYRLQGRIIYITLETESLDRESAMKVAEEVFAYFTTEQAGYYDFQLIIKNISSEEEEAYTMFGSRNRGSSTTVWTNFE